jgi:hypothetical protein
VNLDHSRVKTRPRAGTLSVLIFSACVLLSPGRCFADDISLNIADPSQTATPGQTVDFTGTITNDIEQDLSASDFVFSFSGYNSNLTINQLLGTPNFSIGAGETTSIVDLFSVTLDSTMGPGTYPVDFVLVGGNSEESRSTTGEVSITVTPEPSTMGLMVTGLLIFATVLLRSSRKSQSRPLGPD